MKIDKIIYTVFLAGILTLSSCEGRGQDKESGERKATEKEILEEDRDISATQPRKEQEKESPDEETDNETEEEIDVEKMSYIDILEYVDNKVMEVVDCEEFQNADLDVRGEMVKVVLERLVRQGLVTEYGFELSGDSIWFDYQGGGGGLIFLEDTPWEWDEN